MLLNLFVAPASAFQNRYLKNERGYSASRISLFTLLTNTPGGIGIIAGGRLADMRGRRIVGSVALVGGTVCTVWFFFASGWAMWVVVDRRRDRRGRGSARARRVRRRALPDVAARARPTRRSSVLALVGSGIGLIAAGALADRWDRLRARDGVARRRPADRVHARARRSIPRPRTASSRTSTPRTQSRQRTDFNDLIQSRRRPRSLGVLALQLVAFRPRARRASTASRDRRGRPLELVGRAEGVARARDEQARHVDAGQVLDAELLGLAGRVERIARSARARPRASPSATAIEQMRPPIERPPRASRFARTCALATIAAALRNAPSRSGQAGGRARRGRPCGTGSQLARPEAERPPSRSPRVTRWVRLLPAPGNKSRAPTLIRARSSVPQ